MIGETFQTHRWKAEITHYHKIKKFGSSEYSTSSKLPSKFRCLHKKTKKLQKIREKTLFLDYTFQHGFLSITSVHTTSKLFFLKSMNSQLSNDVFKIIIRRLEKNLFHFLWKKFQSDFLWLFPLHSLGPDLVVSLCRFDFENLSLYSTIRA